MNNGNPIFAINRLVEGDGSIIYTEQSPLSSDFPVSNIYDPRLDQAFRGDDPSTLTMTVFFEQPVLAGIFAIAGHNFGPETEFSLDVSGASVIQDPFLRRETFWNTEQLQIANWLPDGGVDVNGDFILWLRNPDSGFAGTTKVKLETVYVLRVVVSNHNTGTVSIFLPETSSIENVFDEVDSAGNGGIHEFEFTSFTTDLAPALEAFGGQDFQLIEYTIYEKGPLESVAVSTELMADQLDPLGTVPFGQHRGDGVADFQRMYSDQPIVYHLFDAGNVYTSKVQFTVNVVAKFETTWPYIEIGRLFIGEALQPRLPAVESLEASVADLSDVSINARTGSPFSTDGRRLSSKQVTLYLDTEEAVRLGRMYKTAGRSRDALLLPYPSDRIANTEAMIYGRLAGDLRASQSEYNLWKAQITIQEIPRTRERN